MKWLGNTQIVEFEDGSRRQVHMEQLDIASAKSTRSKGEYGFKVSPSSQGRILDMACDLPPELDLCPDRLFVIWDDEPEKVFEVRTDQVMII